MLTRTEFAAAQSHTASLLRESGISITDKAMEKVEVADFGLSRLDMEGAQILTLVSTDRITVKIIVLFPCQTLPEHWHPRVGEDPGKEETVRVVSGTVRFYMPGDESMSEGFVPDGKEDAYTVRHELILKPCEQITLQPGTKHWFQAGKEGAVIYSFSTVARDVLDCFTDPNIDRVTHIKEA
ncbi:MAG: D-lyxose/D-mannose family sugar isomerase [Planctomycetes bacterium]|nr:D-lyxose/D-mannose family sugar isomerase [Planctomycetota bacterium]